LYCTPARCIRSHHPLLRAHSVAATGIAVLAGLTRIEHPFANFKHPFAGSTAHPNALATALIKVNWAYYGWQNGYNVLSEIRSPRGPARTARLAGLLALGLVTGLFLLVNVAYIAAVPAEDMKQSGELVASLFFQRVYGHGLASKLLPLMVALSCIGNIVGLFLDGLPHSYSHNLVR
jgi:amino acid transporter